MRFFKLIFVLSLFSASVALCQQQPQTTIFPHSPASRFWVSGQMNFIFQAHPEFPAEYRGENSLRSSYEKATSRVLTLFTGFRATRDTDLPLDVESSGGRGITRDRGPVIVPGFRMHLEL